MTIAHYLKSTKTWCANSAHTIIVLDFLLRGYFVTDRQSWRLRQYNTKVGAHSSFDKRALSEAAYSHNSRNGLCLPFRFRTVLTKYFTRKDYNFFFFFQYITLVPPTNNEKKNSRTKRIIDKRSRYTYLYFKNYNCNPASLLFCEPRPYTFYESRCEKFSSILKSLNVNKVFSVKRQTKMVMRKTINPTDWKYQFFFLFFFETDTDGFVENKF